jgi:hypothetical protein
MTNEVAFLKARVIELQNEKVRRETIFNLGLIMLC